jgi:hypothetical protein
MKTKRHEMWSVVVPIALGFFYNYCQHETSLQPNTPCIDNQPVEDTTRIYINLKVGPDGTVVKVDTLPISPKILFARFYPWVKDTTRIKQLLEEHHLRLFAPLSDIDQELFAALCVTDDRRSEYHFTPYGKEGFCNFGADSLVEYAFGVFSYGFATPTGNIVFKFVESTPQARIDSLFNANGLRFLYTSPDFPTGKIYWTLVTPRSKKNVLDLANELHFIPFVIYASAELGVGRQVSCNQ